MINKFTELSTIKQFSLINLYILTSVDNNDEKKKLSSIIDNVTPGTHTKDIDRCRKNEVQIIMIRE